MKACKVAYGMVLFFLGTSPLFAPPKKNSQYSIFPSGLIAYPIQMNLEPINAMEPHSQPSTLHTHTENNESLQQTFLTLLGAMAQNVLHEQEAFRTEQQSLRDLIHQIQSYLNKSMDDERKRREDGDKEIRELNQRLDDKHQKLEERTTAAESDIEHHTGKKFLNLFATITSLIAANLSANEIKTALRSLLLWDKEIISHSMLAYLFLITTVIPTFITNNYQNALPYQWFAVYALFAAPFWTPLKLLTQFNVLNRLFWTGFEGLEYGTTTLTSQNYCAQIQNNKRTFALAILLGLIIIACINYKKRYKELPHSALVKKVHHLLTHFFKRHDILLEPQVPPAEFFEEETDYDSDDEEFEEEYEVA